MKLCYHPPSNGVSVVHDSASSPVPVDNCAFAKATTANPFPARHCRSSFEFEKQSIGKPQVRRNTMQTKSPLVRIAAVVGTASIILALFALINIATPRAFISKGFNQSDGYHRDTCDAVLGCAEKRLVARVRQVAAGVRGQSRTDGSRRAVSCTWRGLSIVSDQPRCRSHVAPAAASRDESSQRALACLRGNENGVLR